MRAPTFATCEELALETRRIFARTAPPFRPKLTVRALRPRPDDWDGEIYRRALALDGKVVEVAGVQTGLPDAPQFIVSGARLSPGV
jgi:hypothetical protein